MINYEQNSMSIYSMSIYLLKNDKTKNSIKTKLKQFNKTLSEKGPVCIKKN